MSAADIEGLPSYPTEEGSGRGITLLTSPMSCTLPFVAFPVLLLGLVSVSVFGVVAVTLLLGPCFFCCGCLWTCLCVCCCWSWCLSLCLGVVPVLVSLCVCGWLELVSLSLCLVVFVAAGLFWMPRLPSWLAVGPARKLSKPKRKKIILDPAPPGNPGQICWWSSGPCTYVWRAFLNC